MSRKKRKTIAYIIILLTFSIHENSIYSVMAADFSIEKSTSEQYVKVQSEAEEKKAENNTVSEETTLQEMSVLQETTTPQETTALQETTTPQETTVPQETTTEETTTPQETTVPQESTSQQETTKEHEAITAPTCVTDDNATATNTVSKYTVFSFSKKKKLTAHLYAYSQGKKKTKKVRILVTIQKYRNGKWIKYKKICKIKKSFYCSISKDIRMKSGGKYRALVKVIYYDKRKKKIGIYRKRSKTLIFE